MPGPLQGLLSIVGRLMLCTIFVMSAIGNKIPNFDGVVAYMGNEGVPQPKIMLAGAIVFLIVGSISVFLGFRARFGACLLFVFLVLATYYFHDFWTAREFNKLEEQMRSRSRAHRNARRRDATERDEIEDDVGFLTLTLMGLIRSLVDKGLITRDQLQAEIQALDLTDGEADGRLDPDAAREAFDMQPPPAEPKAPTPRRNRRN